MNQVDGAVIAGGASRPADKPRDVEAEGSKQPGYQGIVDVISERISTGIYKPGGRLPSGSQFCVEFGVSPVTVSRALAALKSQGLVSSVKGCGTFARSLDLIDSSFKLGSVAGAWLDESAEIRLLSVSMARADEKVATKLAIAPGKRVVHIRRLVSYDGRPAMFHVEYVICDPLRPLLESQLQLTSLHAFLDSGRGHKFPQGELTVQATDLDADGAQALGKMEGAPVLRLEHLFRDSDGQPVSLGWFLLGAEQFQLRSQFDSDKG
jgi:GntR family transcriptional regulator